MPRYVLLQKLDDVVLAVAPAADPNAPAVVKQDVAVSYAGHDDEGNFSFAVPAYDPAAFNTLSAIHVGLYEKAEDGTAVTPDDPAEVASCPLHYSTDTSKIRGAETVIVDATDAPEGKYVGLLVLEFAS